MSAATRPSTCWDPPELSPARPSTNNDKEPPRLMTVYLDQFVSRRIYEVIGWLVTELPGLEVGYSVEMHHGEKAAAGPASQHQALSVECRI